MVGLLFCQVKYVELVTTVCEVALNSEVPEYLLEI